jgi:hypothetical protein
MFIAKKFAIIFLLLLTVGSAIWSQVLPTPPNVYVSGGTTIYSVANGTATLIFTSPNNNSNFESLAIGPDNVDTDAAGNAAHPYLLYACDTGTNSIIRFDPTAAVIAAQSVASGLAFPPMCARSTATGDVYITNKSGPGLYQLIAATPLASVPFSATGIGASATRIDTSTKGFKGMTGRGIAQKYIGDLLVVDNADNDVLHSVYGTPPLFTTLSQLSPLITSHLNGPVGIANLPSLRQIFVSNSNSLTQSAVTIFDATGTPSTTTCQSGLSLPSNNHQVPGYLATAPTDQFSATVPNMTNKLITDTIYLVTKANNSGTLWTWNTVRGDCNLVSAATARAPLSGLAVAPAPVTLTLTEIGTAANPVPTNFPFNSSLFQFTATGCDATVTAYPRSQATVTSSTLAPYATTLVNPVTLAVNLGEGGFVTTYQAHNPQCSSVFPDLGFVYHIFNFVDNSQFTNPRILDCTNAVPATEPQLVGGGTTCVVPPTIGVYPLGGPIPNDSGTGTRTSTNFYTLVNEKAGAGTAEPGTFCGFQPDLAGNGTTLPSPLPSFSASGKNTLNVKFKLSSTNCKQNFITDATALLSVARIFDANGAPVFNAIDPNATSASIDVPPLFPPGNSQYSFTLNLPSVFAQGGAGTYSVTVTFLSDNTTNKTTEFILTQ